MAQHPSTERLQSVGHKCELCRGESGLALTDVPGGLGNYVGDVVTCTVCTNQLLDTELLDAKHWFCLNEAIWSEIPAVQVMAYRLLHRLRGESWAADLLASAYLEDDILAWALIECTDDTVEGKKSVDCNGTPLSDGDTITLIKGLDVKGANFTAKRGTVVKNIRLADDSTLIEGRINGVSIFLKTCFIKKSS